MLRERMTWCISAWSGASSGGVIIGTSVPGHRPYMHHGRPRRERRRGVEADGAWDDSRGVPSVGLPALRDRDLDQRPVGDRDDLVPRFGRDVSQTGELPERR